MEAQLWLVQVMAILGEVDQAGQLARQLLTTSQNAHYLWLAGRAEFQLGQLQVLKGQTTLAIAHLIQAQEIFQQIGMQHDLEETRALLAKWQRR